MATYVLIHGAGSEAWYWHLVVPELEARGHSVIAPDLPIDDDSAGIAEYAETVVRAIAEQGAREAPLIIVAQSLGGLIAPLVTEQVHADLIVMLAAMIPRPHEKLGAWWANTGWESARAALLEKHGRKPGDFDVIADFFHDVPQEVVDEAMARGERRQSRRVMEDEWPLDAWPQVPTRFLLCRDDRFFPADSMRRVVRERLGIEPDEMEGGHLPALARPKQLVERLERYRRELKDGRTSQQ